MFHQIASHGPSYFLRYPEGFDGFSPACARPELTECCAEELANAYDNTILYTDWVMAQSIDILNEQDRVIPAMFYVSDHGESPWASRACICMARRGSWHLKSRSRCRW